MTGKVPNLEPNITGLRHKGELHVYWSPFFQKYIARSWPRGNGGNTPRRLGYQQQFTNAVKALKNFQADQVQMAEEISQNTPFLKRDIMMMVACGNLYEVTMKDGTTWVSWRKANMNIQQLLNSISTVDGAMIIRIYGEWISLVPGDAGDVLTIRSDTGFPDWQPASGGGGAVNSVTGTDGVDAITVTGDVTVSLSAISDGSILANISGGTLAPVPVLISDVLDYIGGTEGDMLIRTASGWEALGIGTAGYILTSDGTDISWQPNGGGGGGSEPSIARFTTAPANPGFDANYIYNSSVTLSNSNKTATPVSSSPYNHAYGAPALFTGKRYLEWVPGSASFEALGFCGANGHGIDLDSNSVGNFGSWLPGQVGWESSGAVKTVNKDSAGTVTTIATVATWAASDVLSMALDLDAALLWLRVNGGNWNNSGGADPASGTGGIHVPMLFTNAANGLIWPGCNMGNTSATTMHLLAADFSQSVPTGFTAWGA